MSLVSWLKYSQKLRIISALLSWMAGTERERERDGGSYHSQRIEAGKSGSGKSKRIDIGKKEGGNRVAGLPNGWFFWPDWDSLSSWPRFMRMLVRERLTVKLIELLLCNNNSKEWSIPQLIRRNVGLRKLQVCPNANGVCNQFDGGSKTFMSSVCGPIGMVAAAAILAAGFRPVPGIVPASNTKFHFFTHPPLAMKS